MTYVIWNLTSVYLEIVLVLVKIGARFAPNALEAKKTFRTHAMVLLGKGAQVEAQFGDSANLNAI